MLRSVLAAAGAATLLMGAATAFSQTPATPGTQQAAGKSGANVGSLTCNVAGGVGFVFGSSKDLSCLFTRTDGIAERYTGSIKKFGVDIGFTKEAQIVWLVFAPGNIAPGAARLAATPAPRRQPPSAWARAPMSCWAAATSRSPCSRSASRAASA